MFGPAAAAAAAVVSGFVPVHGHRMYYVCTGTGSPTVVLDAGSPDDSSVWSSVEPQLARTTRVCVYDRAGIGRSAPAPAGERTATTQVHDLATLLALARIPGPYVVVGHSWGGLLARLFAHDYPRRTAGAVLVDATTFPYGAPINRRNREGIDVQAALAESNAVTTLGHLPLVVLGSNRPPLNAKFLQQQDAEARLSSDSVDAIAVHSTHYIQRDQPTVVITAVRAVVDAVRTGRRLPPCRVVFASNAVRCR